MNSLRCLLLICLLSSCGWESVEPDKLVLPPVTRTGQETFGCFVNNEIWAANGGPGCWNCGPNPKARTDGNHRIVYFGARNEHEEQIAQNINFTFFANNNFEVNKAIDFGNADSTYLRLVFRDELTGCYLESDSLTEGSLTVTRFDTDAGILSGTFEAELMGECDTIVINDGRFDLTFRP